MTINSKNLFLRQITKDISIIFVFSFLEIFLNGGFAIAESWIQDSAADFVHFAPVPRTEALSPGTTVIEGWSDDIQLINVVSQAPRTLYDRNGLHLFWSDYNKTYYRKSTDNGRTWTADKILATSTVPYIPPGYYGEDVITYNNILHMVWTDGSEGNFEVYYKRSNDGGETWSSDKRLSYSSGYTMYPSIAIDSTTVYVVFVDSPTDTYKLYLTTSNDGGNTWGVPFALTAATIFTEGTWAPRTRMVSDANGVHIFWTDDRNGNKEVYYKKTQDGGKNWTVDKNLTNSPSTSRLSSLISDTNGLHLFYHDNKDYAGYPFIWEIYYKRTEDGGTTWTAPQRLTELDNYDSSGAVPISDSYGLHLIFSDYRYNGYPEVHYKKSIDGGKTWSVEQRLTYEPASSFVGSIVSVNGFLHLFWDDMRVGADHHVYYKKYDPTPPTGKPTTPVVEYVYQDRGEMRFVWNVGTVTDPESRVWGSRAQVGKRPVGTTQELEIIADNEWQGNVVIGYGLDPGYIYYCRAKIKTETNRYSEWSEWSEGAMMASPLDNVIVYPNPCKEDKITFSRLDVSKARLKIYNIVGELVFEKEETPADRKITWDLINTAGEKVSSGIYLYIIEAGKLRIEEDYFYTDPYEIKKKGKIAVIR